MLYVAGVTHNISTVYKIFLTQRRKVCHQGFFFKIDVDNICKENFCNTQISSAVEYSFKFT